MAELGALWKLLRMGLGVKGFLDARKDLDKHHAALLMDDEYRTTYSLWWEVHLSVREDPELVKQMTQEGRRAYEAFRKLHEHYVPRGVVSAPEEATMLARVKRYGQLVQDIEHDDAHARLAAWNQTLDAVKANEGT